jgi:anaerobic selenocysteine-containing dehydrogenase
LKPGAGDPQDDPETAAKVVAESTEAAARAATAEVPDLHVWNREAPSPESPGRDAYALRLVVARTLYDEGRVVCETPVLSRLRAERPVLHVNPTDASRIGLANGGEVRVSSERGSQTIALEADERVPAGVARFDFTANGEGPAALISVDAPVTDVRVESLS